MPRKYRIGILGCASIAERYLIPNIIKSPKYVIEGVASRSSKKANDFAQKFNTSPFYSYEKLLESKVDAVYIPLPNSLHYKWVKKALESKKHVLVEKSMGCDLKEVRELNKIAEDKGLALVENFQFRFHPQLESIKKILKEGALGKIRSVESKFGFPPLDENNIRYKKELGGGALLDAGAYPIKLAQVLFGNEISLRAVISYNDKKNNVDLYGSGMLKPASSDISFYFSFGFDNCYQNSLEIWGSKARMRTSRIFTAPPGFSPSIEIFNSEEEKEIKLKSANHFALMLDYFAETIESESQKKVEYISNINQSRLIEDFRLQAS